jgi:hypothetical protein
VGVTCESDADCADGHCIRPSDDSPVLAGGAVGGYCSKVCASEADCPSGRCVIPSGLAEGECLLTCELGPPLFQLDDPLGIGKCRQREDVRCTPASDGSPVCLPVCGTDVQCEGRSCDHRTGMCVDNPSVGSAVGTLCDATAPDQDGCSGSCVPFAGAAAVCTRPCVLGGVLDGDDCGGLSDGLCFLYPDGYGAGDDGRCTSACSAHDECGNPDWWCFAAPFNPNGNGFCVVADACPNGDPDCDSDEACADTVYGPRCLEIDLPTCNPGPCELLFPLGAAAPTGSGGAGGGGGMGGGMGGMGGA